LPKIILPLKRNANLIFGVLNPAQRHPDPFPIKFNPNVEYRLKLRNFSGFVNYLTAGKKIITLFSMFQKLRSNYVL